MTYAELLADLASWMHRGDMTAILPQCVKYATAAFNRELDRSPVPEMEARDTRSLTTEYSALPTDFLRMRSITRADGKEIRYVTPAELNEMVARGYEPEPQVYTIEDMQIRVRPAPTVSVPVSVRMAYLERLPALVNSSDTNWLLTDYPDLYLLGALVHARMWVHDDARFPTVVAMYDKALAQLKSRTLTAPGMPMARQTDIPATSGVFDITTGW